MWPEPGEALSRTIAAEAAVEDLFAEAFRRWAPTAAAVAIPTLADRMVNGGPALIAATLPPDPDALANGEAQSAWEQHAEQVVLAGLLALWAVSYLEASDGLGIDLPNLPESPDSPPAFDAAAAQIVAAHTDLTPKQVIEAASRTQIVPGASEFVDSRRPDVFAAPTRVQHQLSAALDDLDVEVTVIPDDRPRAMRAEAERVLDPASVEMRELSRREKFQAAGVLNNAVLHAAEQAEDAAELQKTWIATLDGKTRPTHWAADGQRVALAGAFTVGGEQLAFPGDPTASAAERMNCRCRMGVLAADEGLPDEVDRHTERLDGRDSTAINRDGRTQAEEIERRRDAGNVRARDDEDGIGRVASAAPTEEMSMADQDDETYLTFTDALFAVTGTPTSDGRMLAKDITMTFRDTPMPLQWCEEMEGGHFGSVTVGVIESIALKDGEVRASGYMLNNDNAVKAIDLVSHGVCNPSIDPGGDDFEMVMTYDDGTVVTEENYDEDRKVYATMTNCEILATTIVAIPAFGETRIALNEEREPRDKALVASLESKHQPAVYDPALFADPKLSGPTRLTYSEDGRVFGHIAGWKDQHRSVGLGRIKPPRSETSYAHFHSSPAVHLSDGTTLPVGRLTVGIGHAPTRGVSTAAAQAHYDNVDSCWAIGRIGEDTHGIWFSGVVAPWASTEKVQMGLASPLSGDWRPVGPKGGNLELVAVLGVNTPGFLCSMSTDSAGKPLAMVASLGPATFDAGGVEHLTRDDIKAIMAEALVEQARNVELAQRRTAVLARAEAAVGPPPTPRERLAALLQRA